MAARKDTPTKLAARRREIDEQMAALKKEREAIDEKLLSLDKSEDYVGDGVVLSFTAVHGLDTAFIQKKFPAAKRPEFYKLALDIAEFRKHFSPKELEDFEKITHRIKVQDA